MHASSMAEMGVNVGRYFRLPDGARIADVGSRSVNGCYKPLIVPRLEYVGFDIEPGRNVDIVMTGEFTIPAPDASFDGLISGQCLEHCRNPFRLVAEMGRVVKPGGRLLIVAPFKFEEHRFPVDCWRFLPDGMRELFAQNGMNCIDAYLNGADCWGIGGKG